MEMKKWLIVLGITLSMCLLGACGSAKDTGGTGGDGIAQKDTGDVPSPSPEFEENAYTEGEVKIAYPQVSNLNSDAANAANQEIQQDALSALDIYAGETEGLTLNVNYTLASINDEILSVCFEGTGYVSDAPYPNNLFYTSNVNLATGKRLTAGDMFTIDGEFIETIKENAKYVSNEEEGSQELASEANRIWEEYDPSDLLADIEKAGTPGSEVHVYLKQDSVGFSFPVLHALGDYARFEVEDGLLTQFLKF